MESWKADEKHNSSRVVKSVDRRCNSPKVRRKKIHPRQMLEKSQNAVFFQWFVCQVSRKVGLLKRRVRRSVFCGEIKNCAPLWRNAHLQVKMYKTPHVWSTFWSEDVLKLYAAVAKCTFASENVQNTSCLDHFLKWRCLKIVRRCGETRIRKWKCTFSSSDAEKLHAWCGKIARRCGETRVCKWKCTKHLMSGALFEVQMSKNCTPLWRNAHSQVKMLKN